MKASVWTGSTSTTYFRGIAPLDLLPFSAFAETGNGPESCISAPLFRGQRSIPVAQDAIPDFVREELDGIPETVEPPAGPGPDLTADALTQYHTIVAQTSAYDCGADGSTGNYRYALARMRADSDIPALLLEQDTTFGISNVLVFQYEPDNGHAVHSDGTMSEGVAQAAGHRGGLSAAGDGNGILATEFSSRSGMGSTSRVTLNGDSLQSTTRPGDTSLPLGEPRTDDVHVLS